jgi:conjugal transfer/entry exclusion protein
VNQHWPLIVLLITCLGVPVPTPAQILGTGVIPVVEIGANLAQNTVTATQSVITAVESVLQTANMVLELTPVDEVIVGGQIAEDLALLAEIMVSAELVWYDVQSLEAQITVLFGLDNAPDTRAGLDERLLEVRQFYYRSLTFAMRTQTLMMTMLRTVEHISRLIDAVGALIGNMQGNQVAIQQTATVSKTLTVLEVQTAAWQRADTVDRLSQGVILASLDKINLKRLEDHPRH